MNFGGKLDNMARNSCAGVDTSKSDRNDFTDAYSAPSNLVLISAWRAGVLNCESERRLSSRAKHILVFLLSIDGATISM